MPFFVHPILIEDEVHFLFQCPTYSMIRNKFYYKIKTLIPNITELPINGLINELMNSSNYLAKKRTFFNQKQTRVAGPWAPSTRIGLFLKS